MNSQIHSTYIEKGIYNNRDERQNLNTIESTALDSDKPFHRLYQRKDKMGILSTSKLYDSFHFRCDDFHKTLSTPGVLRPLLLALLKQLKLK